MDWMNIALLCLVAAVVAVLCVRETVHGPRAMRTLEDICREQAEMLMHFHKAGQSLAAHQLAQAQVAVERDRAEADRIRAENERDALQRRLAEQSENGRFAGRPRVTAPVIDDDRP